MEFIKLSLQRTLISLCCIVNNFDLVGTLLQDLKHTCTKGKSNSSTALNHASIKFNMSDKEDAIRFCKRTLYNVVTAWRNHPQFPCIALMNSDNEVNTNEAFKIIHHFSCQNSKTYRFCEVCAAETVTIRIFCAQLCVPKYLVHTLTLP